MGILIKDCTFCGHPHGRLVRRCTRPHCDCHARAVVKVGEHGWPMRPVEGGCPSCGAAVTKWCGEDCRLLDPLDWR